MLTEVVAGVTITGVTGTVGLLWRLTVLTSRQNGKLGEVAKTLGEHVQNDREDFREVFRILAGQVKD